MTVAERRGYPRRLDVRQCVMVMLLLAVVACKAWLNFRININWDEFHYLSQIGGFQRGEHIPVVQTLHVRLFGWLTTLQLLEDGQVLVARSVMVVGLVATLLLLWRLAALWAEGWAAWMAPLAYLLASPVFRHGSSFRPDAILAPALTCSAFLLCRFPDAGWAYAGAGVLFGLAGAVSIKAILALPMILGVIALTSWAQGFRVVSARIAIVGFVALSVFLLSLSLHGMSIAPGPQSESSLVAAAIDKTVFNQELFPAMRHLRATWVMDRLIWLLMAVGFIAAVARGKYVAAALALSMLPLLFYRNAFPYYYVVMLTPAMVLVSVGVDAVARQLSVVRWRYAAGLFFLVMWLSFSAKLISLARGLSDDRVEHQSAVVAAVHSVFPEPVPYIDHSGMIGSFPKVAPFMSTWAVANYVQAGIPFMPAALARRPPLLLVNAPVLSRGAFASPKLLPKDRELLARGYLRYWGPIYVAGVAVDLDGAAPVATVLPPYGGHYRLSTSGAVTVDGVAIRSGEILDVPAGGVRVALDGDDPGRGQVVQVMLIDARARPAPASRPISSVIYDPL